MKELKRCSIRRSSSGSFGRRFLFGILKVFFCFLILISIAFSLLYLRLLQGPLDIGKTPQAIVRGFAKSLQPNWKVRLSTASLQLFQGSPAVRVNNFKIINPQGMVIINADHAALSVGLLSLLSGNFELKAFEMDKVSFKLQIQKDGRLTFIPSNQSISADEPDGEEIQIEQNSETEPSPLPVPLSTEENRSVVSVFVGQIFEQIFAPGGIFTSLDYAKITNADLTVESPNKTFSVHYQDVQVSLAKTSRSIRKINTLVHGELGEWSISSELKDHGYENYSSEMVISNVPIQDILLLSGLSSAPLTTSIKTSAKFQTSIRSGLIEKLTGQLIGHPGTLILHDKDATEIPVDEVNIQLSWNEREDALAIQDTTFISNKTHVSFGGEVLLSVPNALARINLQGKKIVLEGLTDQDPLIPLTDFRANLTVNDGIDIERLLLKGPGVEAEMKARIGKPDDPKGLVLSLNARNSDGRAALRIWPEITASKARRFLVEHVKGGVLEKLSLKVDLSSEDILNAKNGVGLPFEALDISFSVRDGTMFLQEGLPLLEKIKTSGNVSGRSVSALAHSVIPMGLKKGLDLLNGQVLIPDFWNSKSKAIVSFYAKGENKAFGRYLQSPLLKDTLELSLNPEQFTGDAGIFMRLVIPTKEAPTLDTMPVFAYGKSNNLGYHDLFSSIPFEKGNLNFSYDTGQLDLKANGLISGAVTTIHILGTREEKKKSISLSLDDSFWASIGNPFGEKLKGVVSAHIQMSQSSKEPIRIVLDLTKASINQLIPGWTKSNGKSGKIYFNFTDKGSNGYLIDQILADVGSLQAKGSLSITKDLVLRNVSLPNLKISAGDNLSLNISRDKENTKIQIKGNTLDIRGMKNAFIKSNDKKSKKTTSISMPVLSYDHIIGKNIDLEVALNIVTGFSKEALTKFNLKGRWRNGLPLLLSLNSRLGSSTLSSDSVQNNSGTIISLKAEDTGGLLRFLGLYANAFNGVSFLNIIIGNNGDYKGNLVTENVIIKDEPVLEKVIPSNGGGIRIKDRFGEERMRHVSTKEILVNKLRGEFLWSKGAIIVRDVVVWGGQIGITLSGKVDLDQDQLKLSGTYIPAYGLNNAIANIPIVGNILGGSSDEGLLGVNFSVSGSIFSPALSVSPMSAVTPGIFRKIFGEIQNNGNKNTLRTRQSR